MLVKTILNRIHHFKGFVYTSVHYDSGVGIGRIVVDMAPRKNSRGCCSRCKRRSPGYDYLPERVFEFVPLWNIPVFLRYRPRHVSCATCGVIVEELPWATGKSSLCNCFRVFLAQWARLLSWKEVSARFRVSWYMVFDSIKHVVNYGLEHRNLEDIHAIGVDEIAIEKGHKFATVRVAAYFLNCRRSPAHSISPARRPSSPLDSVRSPALTFRCRVAHGQNRK
ncbi:MAG: transposase [Fibrobacter sp.]|nr:transposase [Fibrobacter sp.]